MPWLPSQAVQRARLGEEHRLHLMHTMSDGNCLLHASLLGIWGVHDKQTVGGLSSLRAAMCKLLATPGAPTYPPVHPVTGYGRGRSRSLARLPACCLCRDTRKADQRVHVSARLQRQPRMRQAFPRRYGSVS
jgi:hypothetical protein